MQSEHEANKFQEVEIDLKALVSSLIKRKFLIIALTGFVTIIAFLYTYTLVPSYKATSTFFLPSSLSLTKLNKLLYDAETKESVFSKFLFQLESKEVQKLAFVKGNFLNLPNIKRNY